MGRGFPGRAPALEGLDPRIFLSVAENGPRGKTPSWNPGRSRQASLLVLLGSESSDESVKLITEAVERSECHSLSLSGDHSTVCKLGRGGARTRRGT